MSAFFNQYLRSTEIPTLEYIETSNGIQFRYTNIVENFDMPIRSWINEEEKWIFPTGEWNTWLNWYLDQTNEKPISPFSS